MIVATAGHVDHGKTSLIKNLTGVDTDRLEEEKRRGLSINLGYAYRKLTGCGPIGFVDVPGHTRFINTMIAGINGIDLGMLVVAADDGIMPQTLEHLDVLRLLGVHDYVLVISKIDRVEASRIAEVSNAALKLLGEAATGPVDIFPISNTEGSGLQELLQHLEQRAQACARRSREEGFRLSVDRVFTLKGAGLVVTGTATAGAVNVGDSLELLPLGKQVRIRSLHVQDEPAQVAGAGERCALNIAGDVSKADIERGDWLVEPELASVTQRFDARVELLTQAPFALRHLAPVKLHIGAKRLAARLYLLDPDAKRLQPGESRLVQFIMDGELSCCHGERFVLRDDSESVTLGGGVVLDPLAPRRGKSAPDRMLWLQALVTDSAEQALQTLLVEQGRLLNLSQFLQSWNLPARRSETLLEAGIKRFTTADHDYVLSTQRWESALQRVQDLLQEWHRLQPQQSGMPAPELESTLVAELEPPLVQALLADGLTSGSLQLRDGCIGLTAHQSAVTSVADERWQLYQQLLEQRDKDIPLLSEVMTATGWDRRRADTVARNAVRAGHLIKVTDTRYATPESLARLAQIIITMVAAGEAISVVNFKTRMDTGRKLAIEVLEYFDNVGFTERRDNERFVVRPELPVSLFKG